MAIRVKRVYDKPTEADGCRVLVDRLWPRGLSKENAKVDHWLKELAPSAKLRTWFSHDPAKWVEFRRQYFAELEGNPESVKTLRRLARAGEVTLLFGARDAEHNNAVALKEYLARA